MSLFAMKLKKSGGSNESSLLSTALKVCALHDHPDSREMSVHLRQEDAPDAGTVDLVLRENDREVALKLVESGALAVGKSFTLTLG